MLIPGKYAYLQGISSTLLNETYFTTVHQSSGPVQCLDFYYYITDSSENAKIVMEWRSGVDEHQIVEVRATSENKWQQSRTNFISPLSSSYQVNDACSYYS